MSNIEDAELSCLLSKAHLANNAKINVGKMLAIQSVGRTPLQAVLESLCFERDRLVESRMAAEVSLAQREQEIELEWARERDAKYRQLAQAALTHARELSKREFLAKANAVELTQSKLDQDKQNLETARRELESERQRLQPAEDALHDQREEIDRDRAAWEQDRQRQVQQLDQDKQNLETARRELESERQRLQPAEDALHEKQEKFDRDRRAWEQYRLQQLQQLEHEVIDFFRQPRRSTKEHKRDNEQVDGQIAVGSALTGTA